MSATALQNLHVMAWTALIPTPTFFLGLGLAWFLRPALGNRTWRVALALSLMIHFLSLTWTSATGLLQNLSRR